MAKGAQASVGAHIGSQTAPDRVVQEILNALEQRRLVPGQRLVETELALGLGVGRNAVREAIQRLAARGIVDPSRHRSPSIRLLDITETLEVLEVAEEMFGLLARIAARAYSPAAYGATLQPISKRLQQCRSSRDRGAFSSLRRDFYRTLLEIGANRELHRHFAAIQMQIIYAQFESDELFETRLNDYGRICEAVMAGNSRAAENEARGHVRRVRKIIEKLHSIKTGLL
jgi:DNA-binding GntR family transcriptional regulator